MGESFLDGLGNCFGINYTQNERKRDKYKRLYTGIDSKITKINNKMDKAASRWSSYCSYESPSALDAPAAAYMDAKQKLDEDYGTITRRIAQDLSDAQRASSIAYQKYSHYSTLADREDS